MNFLGAVGRTARNALRNVEGSEGDKKIADLLARVAEKEQAEDRKEALTQLCETVSRSEQACTGALCRVNESLAQRLKC